MDKVRSSEGERLHVKAHGLRTGVSAEALFRGPGPGLPTFTSSLCQEIKDFISLSHCGQLFYSPPNIFLTDFDTHGSLSDELLCLAYTTPVIGINHFIAAQYSLCLSETKFQILLFPLGTLKSVFCVSLSFLKMSLLLFY